jgi:LPS sulfotransferase NodH
MGRGDEMTKQTTKPKASSVTSSVFREFDEYTDSKDDDENEPQLSLSLSLFTPKHRYSIKNNPLCGICIQQWIHILRMHHKEIEFRTYWPRILFVSVMSVINSLLGLVDTVLYEKMIRSIELPDNPVFILGHPRTGTTMLHSLLALDYQQFTYCNTFCAGFPSSFLWFETIGKFLFRGVIDEHRPMDNVPLSFDLPQEDELATNVMSAGISPYMSIFLMNQEEQFRPYFAFDELAGDDDEHFKDDPSKIATARKQWTDSFVYLLKKLTLRSQIQIQKQSQSSVENQQHQQHPPQRLLLKSPVHTSRIKLIKKLFPKAQFIYIHRHPYDVMRSAIHMADTTYWYTYLNTPPSSKILEFIVRQYEILYDRYEEGKQILEEGDLIEIAYDELCADPVQSMKRIYEKLGWNMPCDVQEQLSRELSGIKPSYVKNQHAPLPPELIKIVHERWGPSFERFGYE